MYPSTFCRHFLFYQFFAYLAPGTKLVGWLAVTLNLCPGHHLITSLPKTIQWSFQCFWLMTSTFSQDWRTLYNLNFFPLIVAPATLSHLTSSSSLGKSYLSSLNKASSFPPSCSLRWGSPFAMFLCLFCFVCMLHVQVSYIVCVSELYAVSFLNPVFLLPTCHYVVL